MGNIFRRRFRRGFTSIFTFSDIMTGIKRRLIFFKRTSFNVY